MDVGWWKLGSINEGGREIKKVGGCYACKRQQKMDKGGVLVPQNEDAPKISLFY